MSVPPGRSPNHGHSRNHPYHTGSNHRSSRRSLHAALLGMDAAPTNSNNTTESDFEYSSSPAAGVNHGNGIGNPIRSSLDFNFDMFESSQGAVGGGGGGTGATVSNSNASPLFYGGHHHNHYQQQQHAHHQTSASSLSRHYFNSSPNPGNHLLIGISPRDNQTSHLFHQNQHNTHNLVAMNSGRNSIGSTGSMTNRSTSNVTNKLLRGSTAMMMQQNQQHSFNKLVPKGGGGGGGGGRGSFGSSNNNIIHYSQQYQNNEHDEEEENDNDSDDHTNDDYEEEVNSGGVLANLPPPTEPKTAKKQSSKKSYNILPKSNSKSNHQSIIDQQQPLVTTPLSSMQKLRHLATNILMNSSSTFASSNSNSSSSSSYYNANSSTTAIFYTSILYTKTQSPFDAYLYAKALCYNGEYKRAIGILDIAGLLTCNILHFDMEQEEFDYQCNNRDRYCENDNIEYEHSLEKNNHEHHSEEEKKEKNRLRTTTDISIVNNINDNDDDNKSNHEQKRKQYLQLIVESIILACYCWTYLGEWEQVGSLIEYFVLNNPIISYQLLHNENIDAHGNGREQGSSMGDTYTGANEFVKSLYYKCDYDIQDEEILCRLAHYLHDSINLDIDIHPVSRLCFLRGRAYDEGNNPHRAITFLKLALWIDPKCIEAWQYLGKRRLLTLEDERDLVRSLRFGYANNTNGDGITGVEWLKDFYLASMINSGSIASISTTSSRSNKDIHPFGKNGTAFTPLSASAIGASPIMPVLPEQSTPQLHIDASAIKFQPTPTIDVNDRMNIHSKFNLKPSPIQSSESRAKQNSINEEEEAFHSLNSEHGLSNSPELLTIAATRAYNSYNLPLALHYCQRLRDLDPLCSEATNVQIATLSGLGHKRPLFRLAHALVDADPKSAMAWYAVGCYYYSCGRFDIAQKHFARSIRLNDRIAECWVAYGCAFASCDENDQANTCFRHAQRLYSGSHYPMLYMGMEHLRTNNIPLAGHFLHSARTLSKNDPLCCNELGVWAYRKKDWNEASSWFVLALRLYIENELSGKKLALSWSNSLDEEKSIQQISGNLSDRDCVEFCEEAFWEPTVFNLGQSYRKERRYEDASLCFEKCLILCPGKASSYSALGFTRHLAGDVEGAIELYHQALSCKPDDPFSNEMLNRALEESLDDKVSNNDVPVFSVDGSPMTPGVNSCMSIASTMSSINNYNQGGNSMLANGRSFFSPGDSDVNMSMT